MLVDHVSLKPNFRLEHRPHTQLTTQRAPVDEHFELDALEIEMNPEQLAAGPSAMYTQNLMAGLTQSNIYHPLLTPAPPGLSLLSKEELKSVQPAVGLSWLQWRPLVFSRIVGWAREQEPELMHGVSLQAASVCVKLAETLKLP